jgi:hypothetical protein
VGEELIGRKGGEMKVSQFLASAIVLALAFCGAVELLQMSWQVWRTGILSVWQDGEQVTIILFSWLAAVMVWERIWRKA